MPVEILEYNANGESFSGIDVVLKCFYVVLTIREKGSFYVQ